MAPFAFSTFSTVSSGFLTNGWPSSVTSARYLAMRPSTIFATISAGLPDSAACAEKISRSFAIELGRHVGPSTRATGRIAPGAPDAATCIAMSLPTRVVAAVELDDHADPATPCT